MVRITLNEDQMRSLLAANGDAVTLVDARGDLIGYLSRPAFSREEVAAAVSQADNEPVRYSTTEVLEHLAALRK